MSMSTTKKIIWQTTLPIVTGISMILLKAWVNILDVVLCILWPKTKCIMPRSLTTMATMIDIDAQVSTKPSINLQLIFTTKWKDLLQWVLLMHTCLIIRVSMTIVTCVQVASISCFFLVSFIKPSKYSNSLKIMKMDSMGVKEIFPFNKMWQCLGSNVSIYPKVSRFYNLFLKYFLCLCSRCGCLYIHITFWHFNFRKNIVLYSRIVGLI